MYILVTSVDKNLWLTDYESLSAEVRKIPHVVGCAPRLEYEAWLGRGGAYSDVHIVGIVPEEERRVSELETFFKKGGKPNFNFKDESGMSTKNAGAVLGAELRGSG